MPDIKIMPSHGGGGIVDETARILSLYEPDVEKLVVTLRRAEPPKPQPSHMPAVKPVSSHERPKGTLIPSHGDEKGVGTRILDALGAPGSAVAGGVLNMVSGDVVDGKLSPMSMSERSEKWVRGAYEGLKSALSDRGQAITFQDTEKRTGVELPVGVKLAFDVLGDPSNAADPTHLLTAALPLALTRTARVADKIGDAARSVAKADDIARAGDDILRAFGPDLDAALKLAVPDGAADARRLANNASGESAASVEAINRQASMKARGEQFAVMKPGGRIMPLIGPEAADYRPRPGEKFGIVRGEGDTAQFQELNRGLRGGQVGAISPGAAVNLAGAGVGALVGGSAAAATSEGDPLVSAGGAAGGALAGAAGMGKYVDTLRTKVQQQAVDDILRQFEARGVDDTLASINPRTRDLAEQIAKMRQGTASADVLTQTTSGAPMHGVEMARVPADHYADRALSESQQLQRQMEAIQADPLIQAELRAGGSAQRAGQAAEQAVESGDVALRGKALSGEYQPGLRDVNEAVEAGGVLEPAGRTPSGMIAKLTGQALKTDNVRIAKMLARASGLDRHGVVDMASMISAAENFISQRRLGISFDKIKELADNIGYTKETVDQLSKKVGLALNAEENLAVRATAIGNVARAQEVFDELKDIERLVGSNLPDDIARKTELFKKYEQEFGHPIQSVEQLKLYRDETIQLARASTALMMGVRAEAGRALASWRQIKAARITNDQKFIKLALEKHAVPEDVYKALDNLDSVGRYQYLRNLSKPKALDVAKWYYFTNILSNPMTQMRNIIGNSARLAGDLAMIPTAALWSDNVTKGEFVEQLAGALVGARKGAESAWMVMTKGFSPDDVAQLADKHAEIGAGKYSSKTVGALNVVSRALEATDQFFRQIAFMSEAYRMTHTKLVKSGLKAGTPEFAEAFARKVTDMDVDVIERAEKYSRNAVFRDEPGKVGKWILQLDKTSPKAAVLRLALMPFVTTPLNIMKAGMQFSPIGFASAAKATGRERAMLQARAAYGTAAIGLFTYMAMEGSLTGNAPSDPRERDKFYADGKQPNSILINGKWYPYQAFGPVALPASAVANIVQEYRDSGVSGWTKFGSIVARTINSTLDNSFLSGMFDFVAAINEPERRGEAWLGRTLSGLVPMGGALRAVRNATDPVIRDPDTAGEHIAAQLPGLSRTVRPRVTYTGEDVKRPGTALQQVFWPVTGTPNQPDPNRAFLAEHGQYYRDPTRAAGTLSAFLVRAAQQEGAIEPLVRAGVLQEGGKEGYQLTDKAALEFKREYGDAMKLAMSRLRENREFNNLPATAREQIIERAKTDLARALKEKWFREWGNAASRTQE